MANLTPVTTNMLPVASETFESNLAAGIEAQATTVHVNSLSAYNNGDSVVLTVDPGTIKQATLVGKVDGNDLIECVWTEGDLDVSHDSGATITDYMSSTHYDVLTKLLRMFANQDGTLKTAALQAALNIPTTASPDWTPLANPPSTVVYNGQRSYTLTFNGVDYTDRLNPGTRLRVTRTTAAPTQCTSLNGTNQYWVKTSPNKMTFTDDFVVDADIIVAEYKEHVIASKGNGASGFFLRATASGQIDLVCFNAGSNNYSLVRTVESVPLNKKIRVTAQIDMSAYTATTTTSYIMFDGVNIPCTVDRAGTNPTSFVQAGNLEIGSYSGGTMPFNGKISQVAIFNAKVTQAQMRSYHSQSYTGTEPNLISAYSFNGVATDLMTTTPNNLTAMNSAGYVNDSPFGTQGNGNISSTLDYAIVSKATFSTNTTVVCQVPEGCAIPTIGGISSINYSGIKAPYGMPVCKKLWTIENINRVDDRPTGTTSYKNILGRQILAPIGDWAIGVIGAMYYDKGSPADQVCIWSLATSITSGSTYNGLYAYNRISTTLSSNLFTAASVNMSDDAYLSTATCFYLNTKNGSGTNNVGDSASSQPTVIRLANNLL